MNPEEPTNGQPQETPATAAEPVDIPTLQERLKEEQQRAENFYSNWQRAAADFANFKRRTEQERLDASRFASSMFVVSLLPIVDDLERAMGSVPRELAGLTWIDGVDLIYRKLLAMLENQGIAPIEAVGQPFDPNLHEAVMRAPGEEGKVMSELQRGYTFQGRVIRPALVTVGSGAGGDAATHEEPSEDARPA